MMVFMTTQDHAMNYAPWKCELKHQERRRTERDIDDKLQHGGLLLHFVQGCEIEMDDGCGLWW